MEVSDRILLGNGWYRLWGLAFLVACLPFTLAFDSAPIPPTPFPAGRGRFLVFLCKGLRPLHPRGLGGMRHWGCLRKAGYGGGLAFLVACRPAFSLLCCPPSPKGKDIPPTRARRALFPSGEGGRFLVFLCKGRSPLHPRGWGDAALDLLVESGLWRGAYILCRLPTPPCRYPEGAYLPCRLPTLPLAFDPAPIPPTPFPAGRGRFLVFLCKGRSPLHPRGWRDAALGLLVESGLWRGACFFGCLPPLPLAYFAAPLPRRGRISPRPALAERSSRREGGD